MFDPGPKAELESRLGYGFPHVVRLAKPLCPLRRDTVQTREGANARSTPPGRSTAGLRVVADGICMRPPQTFPNILQPRCEFLAGASHECCHMVSNSPLPELRCSQLQPQSLARSGLRRLDQRGDRATGTYAHVAVVWQSTLSPNAHEVSPAQRFQSSNPEDQR